MRCSFFAISIGIVFCLSAGCAGYQKKRAEFSGSSAVGITPCTEGYNFSQSRDGGFFLSFVDYTIAQGAFHWEILNVDTSERFVFLTEGGLSFPSGKPKTGRYCFTVPSGNYRLAKLFLDETKGIVVGEKEYLVLYQFDVSPSKVTYLGHVEIDDPNNPKLGELSFKSWFKSAGAMFTGKNIPKNLRLEATDQYDLDSKWFHERYKVLEESDIAKCILKTLGDDIKSQDRWSGQ